MTKIGIAISTYTEDKTDNSRYDIINRSLKSLSKYLKNTVLDDIYTVIVVDGPIPEKHKNILEQYKNNKSNISNEIHVFNRKENGGVARTKNTSIKLLLEQKVDYGFLMDDDVEYKERCFEKYVEAMQKTGSHHMGYCQMPELVHPKNEWEKMGYYETNINKYSIMRHGGGGVGCLLSFTQELIKKIGYFKVMKGKYGYEHINFTYRAIHHNIIPFASDIVESSKYIEHIGFEPVKYNKFNKSHSISEEYRKSENEKNKYEWNKGLDNIEPCIE